MQALVEWVVLNADYLTRLLVVSICILTIGSGLFGFIKSDEWKLSERLLEGLMAMICVPTAILVGGGLVVSCLWGIYWGIWG